MIKTSFADFQVHKIKADYSFIHVNLNDEDQFLEKICEYFLSEDLLLRYARNKSAIDFTPDKKNYVALYRELDKFLDDENIEDYKGYPDLESIVSEEFELFKDDDGNVKIRLSKIGRIGEYLFHSLLAEYFKLTCVIPKVMMTTDKNMSVHGIDALFYHAKKKMILFGESKVTVRLSNGLAMIAKSLGDYEEEIRSEYNLVLSNSHLRLNVLQDVFKDEIETSISFDDFVTQAKIENIGVPIFIAHGEETDPEHIIKELGKIKRTKLFGLNTIYVVISLPILDKTKFTERITLTIKKKLVEYGVSVNS